MKRFRLVSVMLASVLCAACLVCGMTGCSSAPNGDPENENNDIPEEKGYLDNLVKNFWQSDVMYDETVLFVAETDSTGNVLSAPQAKLLFPVEEMIQVKQYLTDRDEPIFFTEGEDYTCSGNVLTAVGTIQEQSGKTVFSGNVPYVTDKSLTGEMPFPGVPDSKTVPSKQTPGLYLPFTEGTGIVAMQCSVTYKHSGQWTGAVPSCYADGALKHTVEKLKSGAPVELFVWGDSISTGANSSSVLNMAPRLKTWPELLADNLSSYFGADVRLTNKAVGGWTSDGGVAGGSGYVDGELIQQKGLSALLREDLPEYMPDVALIGFGMNDASAGFSADRFVGNILSMISALRERNPACEIVLIGTMLANPLAIHSQNQEELTYYLKNISGIEEYNCCTVDIGSMHKELLEAGKCYTEMSSNNVNHPNDFLARIYAMNLLTAFIGSEATSA